MAYPAKAPIERFDRYWIPEPNSGCWLWFGATAGNGYGSFYNGDRMVSAHSFSYLHNVGQVPNGLELDHLCRQRCCVNPDHLEPVTRRENTKRGIAGHHMRGKSQCDRGHPFDESNTHWRPDGRRTCKKCKSAARSKRRLRAKHASSCSAAT